MHNGVLADALRKVTLKPYGRGGPFRATPPEEPLFKGVLPRGDLQTRSTPDCSSSR